MAVTQKDIAQRLGISQQVVACALNGKNGSRMSDETRTKILEEASRLGYRPNLAARALTKQKTNLITVWTRNFTSPYYAQILQHIGDRLRESDYEMLVRVLPEESSAKDCEVWQSAQWPVDGILAIEAAQVANQFLKSRVGGGPPVVCLGGYDNSLPHLDYVWVDMYEGTKQAVRHLLEQGCKRVATLILSSGLESGNMRFDAYTDAITEAGLTPEYIVVKGTTRAAASHALRDYIERRGCPDGLFCYNDDLAIAAYRVMRETNRHVPDDVAIVGCDGIEDALYLEQPLSTVVIPVEEMCAHSWDLLQQRMKQQGNGPQHQVLQAQLEIRKSSARK